MRVELVRGSCIAVRDRGVEAPAKPILLEIRTGVEVNLARDTKLGLCEDQPTDTLARAHYRHGNAGAGSAVIAKARTKTFAPVPKCLPVAPAEYRDISPCLKES